MWSKHYEEMTRLRVWHDQHQRKFNAIKEDLSLALDRSVYRRVSEALGSNLDRVSTDQLIRYLILVEPWFRLQIAV